MTTEEKLRMLLVWVDEKQEQSLDLRDKAHLPEEEWTYAGRAMAYEFLGNKLREILEH